MTVSIGSTNGRRRAETATMTRILTISSGAATVNTERRACAAHGFSTAGRSSANGARITPRKEMLAAPRKNALHTLAGGPGRSPAAITSHNISSAGATAAVPITVGSDARRFIGRADMPCFPELHLKRVPGSAALDRGIRFLAAPANILQSCIHDSIFGTDRIHVFWAIGSRGLCSLRGLLCASGRGGLVVASQPGARIRYRFALRLLRPCGLRDGAQGDHRGEHSHFISPFWLLQPARKQQDPGIMQLNHIDCHVF